MAITQDGWFNDTFLKALSNDIALDLGDTTPGVFKGALYTGAVTPDFSQTDPAYNVSPWDTGEASGAGYTAGGEDLTVVQWAQLTATNKVGWRFATVSWTSSTISADGLLVYAPGLSNRAVILRYFGQTYSTEDGTFEISWASEGGAWRLPLRASA